ncbi:MAG: hypothetical protein J6S67_21475 [Methanobrevibacter sp.]|nr:hypothetical protein [Methanobrevibacter sp.]
MIIKLYKNLSEKNHLDKDITQLGPDVIGTLRDGCSIIDPIIKVENAVNNHLTECNYAYIPEFGRYYFINNITCKGNLFEIQMHVDVLSTYKEVIRNNTAVVSRQQNNYNLYLQDGNFKTNAFPHMQIIQFPEGFSSFNFILSVAG